MQHNTFKNNATFIFKPQGLPRVVRHCPKCGTATSFINTEKFRVNANKKNLDIWMIFQCHRCRSTFNLTLHERIHPAKLPAETLEAYMANCPEKMRQVAFEKQVYQRSGTAPELTAQDWVCHDMSEVLIGGPLPLTHGTAFTLQVAYPGLLRADWALQQATGLSRSQLKKLWERGALTTVEPVLKGIESYLVQPDTNFIFREL